MYLNNVKKTYLSVCLYLYVKLLVYRLSLFLSDNYTDSDDFFRSFWRPLSMLKIQTAYAFLIPIRVG